MHDHEDYKHRCPSCGVNIHTDHPMPSDATRDELLCELCYLAWEDLPIEPEETRNV
jgi:hypothetical protein